MEDWLTYLLILLVFLFTIGLLYIYPSKETPSIAYLLVFVGWFDSFVIITLIPYDIYLTLHTQSYSYLLEISWYSVYWNMYALSLFVLPILHSYFNSGEFQPISKLKDAVKKETKFFLILISFVGIFILYLVLTQDLSLDDVPQIIVIINNVWGLFLMVLLLGYGLVGVPLEYWNQGSLQKTLASLQIKASLIEENKKNCKHALEKLVSGLYASNLPAELNWCADIIRSKLPLDYQIPYEVRLDATRTGIVTYEDLVKINKETNSLLNEKERLESLWETLLNQVFQLEDILNAKKRKSRYIHSPLWPRKQGKYRRLKEFIEWAWYLYVKQALMRTFSVLFCLMSLGIIASESTLFVENRILLSEIFNYDYGSIGTQLLCLVPLVYMVYCINIPLFELKLKDHYGLYKNNHTEPSSLVYSSCFMARLVPAVTFNFLLLSNVQNTQFSKVVNFLSISPYIIQQYSIYFPVLLPIFCLLNFFNIYNKFMTKLKLTQLTFTEVLDPMRKYEGCAILAKARVEKERDARRSFTKGSRSKVSVSIFESSQSASLNDSY